MSWFIRWKALLLAAAFLALGGCLLLAGEGILSDAGVRRETADLPGGRGSLWTPVGIQTTAEISDDEDGHDHAVTVISGGAALVLTDAFDGSRSLAAELARRGVTTLLYGGSDPAAAWEMLRSLGGKSGTALLAGADRSGEALALAGRLWKNGDRCAAVILLGNEETLRAAGDYPGGNILILTRTKPTAETLTAFYGSQIAAERGFDGFFGEGTARACAWDGEFGSFARRETLSRVAEWRGSAMGHPVEIPDSDQIFSSIIQCQVGAALCLLLAVGTLMGFVRRRKHTD